MPNIPTITSPAEVPIPQINPRMTGEPGAALARSGEQMSSAADYGLQVSEKIRDAQNHLALLSAGNQVDAAWDKYQETLRQSGDPDNLPDAEAWKDNLKATFAADPKYADPRVAHALEAHIDSVGEDARHSTVMRQLDLQGQQEMANLSDLQTTVAFEMAEAPDPTMRSLARGRYEVSVTDAERHGWITPKTAEIQLKQLDSTAERVEITNAIDKENPDGIQAMIGKTNSHPELFKDIDPKEFAELKEKLRNAYDVAKDKTDRMDVAAHGDAILDKYRNDVTLQDPETKQFDPAQGASRINSENVPTNVKKYVREELEQEDGAVKKLQNDNDTKLLNDLDPLVESGQLTAREITRRENLPSTSPDWMPRRVADAMLSKANQIQRENRIVDMQERGLARQERLDTSADLRDQLLSQPGYLTSQGELTPYRLKGLMAADANIVWKARNAQGDRAWVDAVKRIDSSPAFNDGTDESKAAKSAFFFGFAKTVEAKHLTGQQITDELTKELDPPEKSAFGAWLDKHFWPSATVTTTVTEKSSPGTTPPTSRQGYFDAMKKANPKASDADINAYLDKKGVK